MVRPLGPARATRTRMVRLPAAPSATLVATAPMSGAGSSSVMVTGTAGAILSVAEAKGKPRLSSVSSRVVGVAGTVIVRAEAPPAGQVSVPEVAVKSVVAAAPGTVA